MATRSDDDSCTQRNYEIPVIFDPSHAGRREFVSISKAAIAWGQMG